MNDHVSVEDLATYVDGRLANARKAELESHFSQCGECLDALAEIVELQGGRARIPGEFLRQALGEKQAVRKRILPMRLVFEIAAAFLVVVVVGYFFLGGSRLRQAVGTQKEMADASATRPVKSLPPVGEKKRPALVGGVTRAEAAESNKMPVEKKVEAAAVPLADSAGGKDQAAAFRSRESAVTDENELREQDQKLAALPALTETDKMSDAQIEPSRSTPAPAAAGVAQPALAARARTAMPEKKGKAYRAAPGRTGEFEALDEESFRSHSGEAAAISRARQLFLAAAGRPVAPGEIKMAALAPRSRFQLEGDVAWADLRDSEPLDGWSWFRKGLVLELQVDGAGEVTAVIPVGQWERSLAETAATAARQLRFSVSAKKSRRARISVSETSPN
jgi:hypothetical protein